MFNFKGKGKYLHYAYPADCTESEQVHEAPTLFSTEGPMVPTGTQTAHHLLLH